MSNETIFTEVFGCNPVIKKTLGLFVSFLDAQNSGTFEKNFDIKVIDFLITFQLFDYPLTEITKSSGVSYSTLQIIWPKLERNSIVIKTRRVGKSDLYKLNTQNPAVQQLIKLDWNLIQANQKVLA